jgi:acyl-CoA thioesterase-1
MDTGPIYNQAQFVWTEAAIMKATNPWLLAIGIVLLLASSILFTISIHSIDGSNVEAGMIRIACVGDSITEGTRYPNDLSTMLGSNYSVRNFGAGATTVSLESDKPYMDQPAFQSAKEFLPNIVIIMLGTNDAPAIPTQHILNFTSDYETLIRAFQILSSKPQIWLVKPPPIFDNALGLNASYFLQEVIPRIENVANETGLPLIDVYTQLVGHPEYFSDGVHPNSDGARIVASRVFDAITSHVVG